MFAQLPGKLQNATIKGFDELLQAEMNGHGRALVSFTQNYVKVCAPYDPLLVNEIKEVKLTTINAEGDVNIVDAPIFV